MRQRTQPRPSTFSFGGHLFEWPEADGKTAPLQKAPDSWQELFASNHFRDPDIALTTLETCKRGHQFTLERAPRLSLFLDTTLPTPVFQSKQQAVSALIVKRQPLTTGLRLVGTRTGARADTVINVRVPQGECQDHRSFDLQPIPVRQGPNPARPPPQPYRCHEARRK